MANENGQNKSEEKKMPKVTVGALILNKSGKFLIIKSPKWKDKGVLPGGHIDWGESIEQALKREIKEEAGLEIREPEFLKEFEFIKSDDYLSDRHIVTLDYLVKTDAAENEVKSDPMEVTEFMWLDAEEILSRDDMHYSIKEIIRILKEKSHKEKKGLFHRECKHCDKRKKEAEDYKTGWQRAVADYRNLQKEIEDRKSEWFSMSERQILEEFLPVYDNFKKSMFHAPNGESTATPAPLLGQEGKIDERWENWRQGIEHIMKQFGDILRAHGVEEIKTVGEKFDPKFHEAVGEEESAEVDSHMVTREVDAGYKMKDRVIKVAMVIVSK